MSFTVAMLDDSGKTCTQPVSILIVAATCPNWNGLLWGVPSITTFGAGSGSFTPNNTTGNSFDMLADAPVTFFPNPDECTISASAQVSYKGPACNCNLHVVSTTIGPVSSICATVDVLINGVSINFPFPLADFFNKPAGTYDFPFTIPDTAGATVTVSATVTCTIPCNVDPGSHLQIHLVGSFNKV